MDFIEHLKSELEKQDIEVELRAAHKDSNTDLLGHYHVVTKGPPGSEEIIRADVTDSSITLFDVEEFDLRMSFHEIAELYQDKTGTRIQVRFSEEPHEKV